jgi:hypothetical protein
MPRTSIRAGKIDHDRGLTSRWDSLGVTHRACLRTSWLVTVIVSSGLYAHGSCEEALEPDMPSSFLAARSGREEVTASCDDTRIASR